MKDNFDLIPECLRLVDLDIWAYGCAIAMHQAIQSELCGD
jgi:hypothetical protein